MDNEETKNEKKSRTVDEFGRVRGVGQAILTYPEVEKNFPKSLKAPLTDFIQATNLGCLTGGALGQILNPAGFEATQTAEACKAWNAQSVLS
jgi:hypothetical protein